jgi:hypothetical protein
VAAALDEVQGYRNRFRSAAGSKGEVTAQRLTPDEI